MREITNRYGSIHEAELEAPELYDESCCKNNPDSPFFDKSSGYDVDYMREYIDNVEDYCIRLSNHYHELEMKIDILDRDITNLSIEYFEDYTLLRDHIGRLLIQKDLLLQELRETHKDIKLIEENIEALYDIADTFSDDFYPD